MTNCIRITISLIAYNEEEYCTLQFYSLFYNPYIWSRDQGVESNTAVENVMVSFVEDCYIVYNVGDKFYFVFYMIML